MAYNIPSPLGTPPISTANDNVDIYLDVAGNDSNDGSTPATSVRNIERAQELKSPEWRQYMHLNFGAGNFIAPKVLNHQGSGPVGSVSSPETWIGTPANQLGGTRTATAGTTSTALIDSTVSGSFRTGSSAVVSSVVNPNNRSTFATITGMSGLVAADAGPCTTTLTADPGASGVTLDVVSTADFSDAGLIYVESEQIRYTSKNATQFLGCSRGQGSTVATAHAVGKVVSHGGGNQFYFSLNSNAGNNGHFQCVSIIDATSGLFVNSQAVANADLMYWQDSYRGSFLKLVTPTTITCVAVASLVNNDFFTIQTEAGPIGESVVFEYKTSGAYVAIPGRTTIDVSSLVSASDVATATAAAISSALSDVTATPAAAVVTLSRTVGTALIFSLTENVANAGFLVKNESIQLPGMIISHGTEATGTVNCVAGSLLVDGETITIGDGTNPAVVFEFDSGGGVAGANVAVPFTAADTSATVAASLKTAINALSPTVFRIRATNTAGNGQVQLKNMIPGTSGNVTITDTVANAGFTTTGMSGGIGAPLTTFTVDSAFSPAPVTGSMFVVQKPGTVILSSGMFLTKGFIGTSYIKVLATDSITLFNLQQSRTLHHASEFDLNGSGQLNTGFMSIFCTGSFAADWQNDSKNPFYLLSNHISKVFVHNGTWQITNFSHTIGSRFILNHLSVNVQFRSAFATSATISGFRTTINATLSSSLGAAQSLGVAFDGSLLTGDEAIIKVERGSYGDIQGSVSNSLTYGILVQNGSDVRTRALTGTGNAKTGIAVDRRSGATIDFSGTTTVTGNLGDTEFGHETIPNYRSYTAVKTADATGTKGYQDDHGNRIDA